MQNRPSQNMLHGRTNLLSIEIIDPDPEMIDHAASFLGTLQRYFAKVAGYGAYSGVSHPPIPVESIH